MELAYLDPGSGSMIVGAVAAGAAGVAVAARTMAQRIRGPFRRKGSGAVEDSEPETDTVAEVEPSSEA